MKRHNISLSDPASMAMALGDGNIGATTLLLGIAAKGDFMETAVMFLNIDDLNMRGEQIWVAYKFAGNDPVKFAELINKRNPEMMRHVNDNCPRSASEQVFNGASYKRK